MSQRLGEYLKEARVKAGLSLEQLSTRTRIRVENLSALEREELEALPADPYVRGFVKIVCRELRLSPDEGLALYSKLRSNTILPDEITWSEENAIPEPGALEKALQDPDRVMDFAKRARRWAIPVGAIVLLGLLTLVVRGGKISAEEDDGVEGTLLEGQRGALPPPPAPAPKETTSAPEAGIVTPGASASPEAHSDPKALETAVRANPEASRPIAKEESETASLESVNEKQAAAAVPPVEADGDPTESATDAADAPVEDFAEVEGQEPALADTTGIAATPPDAGEPVVLEIMAVRDTEVTLLLDGVGLPRKRSLIAGERKSWKADSLFVLSVSDGGAVLLKLDDAYLGSAGMDGETVVNLTVRK